MNERTETITMAVSVLLMLVAIFVIEHYMMIEQVTRGY